MAELMQVLTAEDIVPHEFTGVFAAPVTRAKILAVLGTATPFERNTTFVISNGTKRWFVLYEQVTDQYWYEELTKAV